MLEKTVSRRSSSAAAPAGPRTPFPRPTNLGQRILTSLIVLPFVLVAIVLGEWAFVALIVCGGLFASLEFYALQHGRPDQGVAIVGVPCVIGLALAFYLRAPALGLAMAGAALIVSFLVSLLRHRGAIVRAARQTGMTAAGLVYVGLPCGFLLELRHWPHGLVWMLVVLALTWGSDTFAYIGGRLWGRTPLAPTLSPKKTREGAIAGYFGGLAPALIILAANGLLSPLAALLCAVGPLVAIAGDLCESALKRHYGAKDSHVPGLDVLPGHGGVLDRVDALLFVTAWVYLCVVVAGLPR
jgi:phosphatidate cytidylyltransferase